MEENSMKKILVLLLVLTCVLSLASCDLFKKPEEEHTVHTDNNGDGFCDGCGGIVVDYDNPTAVGEALADAIETQFKETKSFKLEFDLSVIAESVGGDAHYNESVVHFIVEYSMGANGVNAMITTKSGARISRNEEIEYYTENTNYIIDGYSYSDVGGDYYQKSEVAIPEQLVEAFKELGAIEFLTQEQKDELLTKLGVEMATVFNIRDYKGSYSVDGKPAVDKLLEYIDKLDPKTKTIENVLDDVLKQISSDLTTAKIINEAERFSGLTVEEALDELDAWLTKEHNTTLQGIYDSIVTDAQFIEAFKTIIIIGSEVEPDDEDFLKQFDEVLKQLQEFDIRKALEDAEVMDTVIYDFFADVLPKVPADSEDPNSESVPISREELFATIRNFLSLTLEEFEEMIGTNLVDNLKQYASMITVNKINAKMDLNFTNILEIESVCGEANIDFEIDASVMTGEAEDKARITVAIDFKLSEISSGERKIALPEDVLVLTTKFTSGSNTARISYYGLKIDGVEVASVYFTIYDPELGRVEITAYEVPVVLLTSSQTSVSDYNMYAYSAYIESYSGNFVFKLDHENGTFTIIKMPEYEIYNWD